MLNKNLLNFGKKIDNDEFAKLAWNKDDNYIQYTSIDNDELGELPNR